MMDMATLRMGQGQGHQCTIIDPGQEKFIKRFMGHVKSIALIIAARSVGMRAKLAVGKFYGSLSL